MTCFLSGRPMWVNPEINASDAFVAAFLPGSEGGGVADLLFRDAGGGVRHDFKGRLSFSWPKRADQSPLNVGDAGYDPLFAFGHGLKYGQTGDLPTLSEDRPPPSATGADGIYFARGAMPPGWSLVPTDGATARAIDRRGQEDARLVTFTGRGNNLRRSDAADRHFSRDQCAVSCGGYRVECRRALRDGGDQRGFGAVPARFGRVTGSRWRSRWAACQGRGGHEQVTTPFALATSGRLTSPFSVQIASAAVPRDRCSF